VKNNEQQAARCGRRGVVVAGASAALTVALTSRGAVAQAQSVGGAAPANAAIWIKYNLNTATDQQLLGVPGAGDNMTREFKEYRPYTSIGQFRAELGKYISPDEVAAFEQYLFVPVDPNEADADTLQQLPGVNADVAQALSAGRPYASLDAFLTALGQKVAAELAAIAGAYLAS
jgi:DNA uptake protein ComE-like DNA-binding protein